MGVLTFLNCPFEDYQQPQKVHKTNLYRIALRVPNEILLRTSLAK